MAKPYKKNEIFRKIPVSQRTQTVVFAMLPAMRKMFFTGASVSLVLFATTLEGLFIRQAKKTIAGREFSPCPSVTIAAFSIFTGSGLSFAIT